MIRRPPRSTLSSSSAASDVYKRQYQRRVRGKHTVAMRPCPVPFYPSLLAGPRPPMESAPGEPTCDITPPCTRPNPLDPASLDHPALQPFAQPLPLQSTVAPPKSPWVKDHSAAPPGSIALSPSPPIPPRSLKRRLFELQQAQHILSSPSPPEEQPQVNRTTEKESRVYRSARRPSPHSREKPVSRSSTVEFGLDELEYPSLCALILCMPHLDDPTPLLMAPSISTQMLARTKSPDFEKLFERFVHADPPESMSAKAIVRIQDRFKFGKPLTTLDRSFSPAGRSWADFYLHLEIKEVLGPDEMGRLRERVVEAKWFQASWNTIFEQLVFENRHFIRAGVDGSLFAMLLRQDRLSAVISVLDLRCHPALSLSS
eukprot:TRINITY_DN17796_c0_g1_i1.p1 TRINITY_DN17796_c0_g1~~TRINITY_DN17796_c0_g1_i1.p1  ORF type:complete len:372 (-),score=32.43 TRINITY_DN17796_c0_g1_i1:528-1643(-)